MKRGAVYLVGAGPGDPELLTLKAKRLLSEADWIIYDYLVNPEHLRHASAACRSLCVGKGFRHKKLSQRRINALILREAKRGHLVVRLKGGDPYLFGRGGEEALFLKKHRIYFEVVPGVTSATAVANYAGIPLTHREHNASVTLLTGHRAGDDSLDGIDWKRIATMPGTLVIYMGLFNLEMIAKRLIRFGMNGRTPVAVIEWGTLPRQRKVAGPLEGIARSVRRARLEAPCLVVIGDVVSLHDRLNWFEHLPLFGRTVWVTRMKEKAGVLSEKLRRLGAAVEEIPMIRVRPPRSWREMDRAIERLGVYEWLVFTSAYGIDAFFGRLTRDHGKDVRLLKDLRIACVGSESASRLSAYGLRADAVPAEFKARALPVEMVRRYGSLRGSRVLLAQGRLAPDDLRSDLEKCGAVVTRVEAYDTIQDPAGKERLRRPGLLAPDAVVLTSSSAATALIEALGPARARALSRRSFFASIGPSTTGTLKARGVRSREAAKHDLDGVVELLKKAFAAKRRS